MIYLDAPEHFQPKFEVSSCFVEHDGKILLLHRQDHKPQGNTWGIPAGKVDEGETPAETIVREIREEIGLELTSLSPTYFKSVYVKYPEYDFVYHMFHLPIGEQPSIILETAAFKAYKWVTPSEALGMTLIPDEDACIKLFYNI